MKTLLINMLLMISLVASAPLLAQEDPLKVGMSGQYFPFTFVEQDKLKGFDVDVMKAIGKELGREIQFETANFSGLMGMLESGRIDTVANQITITEERKKAYIFSEPYVYDGAQVVTKEGNTEIQGVEDLKGKTVAVNLGSNFAELLRVIDSLQLTSGHKVATPADWRQGEDVIILPSVSNDEAQSLFPGGWDTVKPYLRKVPDPS